MRVREMLIVCELTTNSHSGGVSIQHNAETHTHTHTDTESDLHHWQKLLTSMKIKSVSGFSQHPPVEHYCGKGKDRERVKALRTFMPRRRTINMLN